MVRHWIRVSGLEEFESVKDYLSVMVVNTAENRKLLEQVPHKEVADLSLLCYADLPVEQGGYNATFKITEQMLQKWNVDREELFQIASENTNPANDSGVTKLRGGNKADSYGRRCTGKFTEERI